MTPATLIVLQLGQPTGHVLTPRHFGVNVEFFREYLAEGVATKQEDFAAALHAAGVKALRFPGGNPAYYYLPESRQQSMSLAHATGHWEFREDQPHSNGFVTLEQLALFARKYDFKLLYELPCLFHLDGDTPRATTRSKFSDRAGNFDRDRVAEGVAYGMGIVRRLRRLEAPVALWELGNEEFAHCQAADYAKVTAGYVQALRTEDPKTPVTVVAMGKDWLQTLAPLLREAGVLDGVRSFQAHYPFGNWPGPGQDGDKGDAAAFALGDLKIERWLAAYSEKLPALGLGGTPLSITETTAMHQENWDPHAVIGTQGHALCYAWNWMTLLADPRVDCAVFHDCATPFFGMLRHNVGWDAASRHFRWLNAPSRPEALSPVFPGQYVLSPTACANRLLAELAGEELVEVKTPTTPEFRALASRNRVVAVNRTDHSAAIELPFAIGSSEAAVAESLSACLPGDFRVVPVEFGNGAGRGRAVLPAWSVAVVRRLDKG